MDIFPNGYRESGIFLRNRRFPQKSRVIGIQNIADVRCAVGEGFFKGMGAQGLILQGFRERASLKAPVCPVAKDLPAIKRYITT